MGWFDKMLGRDRLAAPSELDAAWSAAEPEREHRAPPMVKSGEQAGARADPQGKRVYHEYFVGEDRGDGHYPWATRVYTGGVLHSEKQGLATTAAVARTQADNWGLAIKAQILGAP